MRLDLIFSLQCLKFALAVGKCQSISPFYSICLSKKNAEAVKFLEILKKSFPSTKKEFFCKRKKDFFLEKTFLHDTKYSCEAIFIIHTFISYIFNSLLWCVKLQSQEKTRQWLNRFSFPETLCYALNKVTDVIHFFLSKQLLLLKSLCYALN